MPAPAGRKPIVAIFPRVEERINNNGPAVLCQAELTEAILSCGGVPVILSPTNDPETLRAYVDSFDAFVAPGGVPDLDPSLYGQERLEQCGPQDPVRDAFETAIIPLIVAANKPFLGICRGSQALNVSLGGTLWQDLPTQVQSNLPPDAPHIAHNQGRPFEPASHTVHLEPHTLVARAFNMGETGGELAVNSVHHQSNRNVAPGLAVGAWAPDGIVESLELPGKRFILGLQWHPEMMWQTDPVQMQPFEALVEAARG